ncbi:MAG TPA: N-acetyltransferase [Gammaproteobacteria bacterium]|nr:N-acetyltransferase [Gammaproteobacteria bacterium]HIL97691.1 N-acetyltransferase [Pseudomonadales bacterium]
MLIRECRETDMEEVVAVYNQSRASVACFTQGNVSRKDFKSLVKNEQVLLAVREQQVVGFVSIWAPEKFIHHLYINPDQQKKGAANALIKSCIERHGLPLSLKSLTANTNACRYYENNNWVAENTGEGSEGIYCHYWLRSP